MFVWPKEPPLSPSPTARSPAGNVGRSWPGVVRHVVARRARDAAPLAAEPEAEADRGATWLGLGKGQQGVSLFGTSSDDPTTTIPAPTSPTRETCLTRRRIPVKGAVVEHHAAARGWRTECVQHIRIEYRARAEGRRVGTELIQRTLGSPRLYVRVLAVSRRGERADERLVCACDQHQGGEGAQD